MHEFESTVRTRSLLVRGLLLVTFVAQAAVLACAHDARVVSRDAPAGTLRIYLARHGQTDWNAQQRMQGRLDVPLNDKGREQAHLLVERMRGVALAHIYCSSLSRSRETAQIVAGGRPVESLPGLDEQAYGKFQGKVLDGSDTELQKEFDRRRSDPDDALDGGESANQHLARVKATLEMIRETNPSGQILIVGHGGTNAQVLRALFDLTYEQSREIHQDNDELYLIDILPGRGPSLWKLIPAGKLKEL
jgi:probable phosphoglycerate mutase